MTEVFALRGRVVTSNRIITDGAVVISGDAIVWVGEAPDAKAAGFGDEVLAATSPSDDRYLLPGLIDVHCHGGQGGIGSQMLKLKNKPCGLYPSIYAGGLLLW